VTTGYYAMLIFNICLQDQLCLCQVSTKTRNEGVSCNNVGGGRTSSTHTDTAMTFQDFMRFNQTKEDKRRTHFASSKRKWSDDSKQNVQVRLYTIYYMVFTNTVSRHIHQHNAMLCLSNARYSG
jgi:hypothetical protein